MPIQISSENRYALVTGASSGIGKALAVELASRGIIVFAGARRIESMENLIDLGITVLKLDVNSLDSIKSAYDEIAEITNGKLHYLFNNAGINSTYPALDIPFEMARECFETNVLSIIRINQIFSPMIIKVKGRICFTGSIMSFVPTPYSSVYCASKAAISAYSNCFRIEMMAYSVQVTNFMTGAVNTDIREDGFRDIPPDSIVNTPEGQTVAQNLDKTYHLLKPMAADIYAKRVCDDFLKSKVLRSQYFRGSASSLISWVYCILPTWLFEFCIIRFVGFDKLITATRERIRNN